MRAGLNAHCARDRSSERPRPQLCPAGSRPEGSSIPQNILAPCLGAGILEGKTSGGHEEQCGGSIVPTVGGRASQKQPLIIPQFNHALAKVLSPGCALAQHPKSHPAPPAPSHAPQAMHTSSSSCCTPRGFPPASLLPGIKIPSPRMSRCWSATVSILSRLLACPLAVLALRLLLSDTPPCCRWFGQTSSSAAAFAPNLLPAGSDRAGEQQYQVLAKRQFRLASFRSLRARMPAPLILSSFQSARKNVLLPASPVAQPCPHPSSAPGEAPGFSPVLHGWFFLHGSFPPSFCSPAAWRCLPVPAPCQARRVIFRGCQRSEGPAPWRGGD